MYHNYPNIQNVLHRFKHDNRTYDTMYQCRMDRKIHRWLYKIYSYSQTNIGALDGNLRKYISYLLEHYDTMLEDQKADLAYKIKAYIQEHYCDNALYHKIPFRILFRYGTYFAQYLQTPVPHKRTGFYYRIAHFSRLVPHRKTRESYKRRIYGSWLHQ
ncbi:Uncharacterised protein [Sphingobacterium daejeonense]|nr:Uncharacterised protein [Sphingobacterium daejeonense]